MQLITRISSYACATTSIVFFWSSIEAAGLSFQRERGSPGAAVPVGIFPSPANDEIDTVVHDKRNRKETKFFMPTPQKQAEMLPVAPQQKPPEPEKAPPPTRRCNRPQPQPTPLLSKSGNSNGYDPPCPEEPPPCRIEPGIAVKLVDSRDQLIQDFGTNVPKVKVAPVAMTPLTQNTPAGSMVLNVHSTSGFASGQSVAIDAGTDREEVARIASIASIHLQQPLIFEHPAGAEVRVLPPEASTLCRYHPRMDSMVGKSYVVRDMKYGCVGLPSPDGTQQGVWYFPEKSLTMWGKTEDGQAPNVAMLPRKFLGDPRKAEEMEVAAPGRGVEGWNVVKPTAPDFQERVDFDDSLNMPHVATVRQIKRVDCLEAIHKDPDYVCDQDAYKRGEPGVQPVVSEVVHSKQSSDTDVFHPSGSGKKLKMETEFFRPSEQTLPHAQGVAEWKLR